MASQQPTHCHCKNCGSLPVARFSSTQITRCSDDDRRCASCIANDAAEKKAASQQERLAKHAERVLINLPEGAADASLSFKRGSDGSIRGVIRRLRIGSRIVAPPQLWKTSVTSRELVAAGATVDRSISDDAMIQFPCTGKDYRGGRTFKVQFVTSDGAVFDIKPQIRVTRFEQGDEPTVDASSMKLLLRRPSDQAAVNRAAGTGRTWRDSGRGHEEVRQAILAGDWDRLAKLCRAEPYVQELKYPEGCLKPNAHVVAVRFYNVHTGGLKQYGSFGSSDEAVDLAARHVAANVVSRFVLPGDDMLSEAPASLLQDVKDSEEGALPGSEVPSVSPAPTRRDACSLLRRVRLRATASVTQVGGWAGGRTKCRTGAWTSSSRSTRPVSM